MSTTTTTTAAAVASVRNLAIDWRQCAAHTHEHCIASIEPELCLQKTRKQYTHRVRIRIQ